MAGINEYDKNPDNNTIINGINIAEGCKPGNVNNAMRQQMADTLNAHTYVLVTDAGAPHDAINTQRYLADTTAQSFTIVLPQTPDVGDRITVRDAGDWSVNPLTIGRNGNSIGDDPNDLVLNVSGAVYEFVWDGGTWEFTPITSDGAQLGQNNLFTGDNTFSGDTVFTGSITLGHEVHEFSTDGTLAGNSDDAVPTEKAVKTYVDAQQSDYLGGDNTWTGTNNFTAQTTMSTAAATQVTIVNPITEFSIDPTLGSNADTALPSEKAVKTYVDTKTFNTAQIADGSITNPKLADNSVGSTKVSANAVGTTKIQDDAVTLEKMATGIAGNLITYSADGDPTQVNTGVSGQILTSNGAGSVPTFQTPVDPPVAKAPTMQVFTSSGTWTRPEGCTSVHVRATGGGGGGRTMTSTSNSGSGGGAGGTLEVIKDVTGLASTTVTVGAGGTVDANGLNTHFETHVAPGGFIGDYAVGGNGGGAFQGTNDLEIVGGQGQKNNNANYLYGSNCISIGGSSSWGGPGAYGSGGNASAGGSSGIVVVTEYYT